VARARIGLTVNDLVMRRPGKAGPEGRTRRTDVMGRRQPHRNRLSEAASSSRGLLAQSTRESEPDRPERHDARRNGTTDRHAAG